MKKQIITEIKRRIQNIQESTEVLTAHQKGILKGLKIALQIVKSVDEPVTVVFALTKRAKKIHDFYESHGVFSRIKQLKSEGLSTYAITNQLNLEKIPTFQGKFWNQTQVARVLKMIPAKIEVDNDYVGSYLD